MVTPPTIAIFGALDTKGIEFAFLKTEIEKKGFKAFVVDTGVLGGPAFKPDVTREEVAQAGGEKLSKLAERNDRGQAIAVMTQGAAIIARKLHADGKCNGIISMGGGAGTVIGTSAMRALPVGVPKLMVSTVASGDVGAYVGTSDITMMPSIVDVAGLNRISRLIISNAAAAACGMASNVVTESEDQKPLIAATMFGNTTPAVDHARHILEKNGYEVLVFHATGTGGKTMEALIRDGYFVGVLDITTTEWADELCGGVLSAGPDRLSAAAETGLPQVVVPGCIDMCNFWAPNTVPDRYKERIFYHWNPNVTLMRTTPEENAQLARIFAEKLNPALGAVTVMIPRRGFSQLDLEGKPFFCPEANHAFIDSLKANLRKDIPIIEMDVDINDPSFSGKSAEILLSMLQKELNSEKQKNQS
jgi:uncharacterized protein (UPF0261 family)